MGFSSALVLVLSGVFEWCFSVEFLSGILSAVF